MSLLDGPSAATDSATAAVTLVGLERPLTECCASAAPQVRVLTKPDAVWALRPKWDALWRRADGNYRQAFVTCFAAWEQIMAPLGATLHVVVCFEDDELVAIWPLVRRRQALWRVLNQLGPLTPDFSDVLVEQSPRANAYVGAIWQSVQTTGGADLIILPSVKATTRLGNLLARSTHIKIQTPDIAPYVSWRPSDTWETYYGSLGRSTRKKLNRLQRQLQAKGDLRFEAVRAPERMPGLIGWLLQEKRVWADSTGKRGAWLLSDRYERFLVQQAMEQGSKASFVIFLLTLDGEPIAAMFSMEGPRHTEGIIASFSARLARLSPGLVLYQHIMRHAFDCGSTFELGIGNEQVKLFWSRDISHETASYRLALTPWGVVSLWLLQILKTIRSRGPWLGKNRVSVPAAGEDRDDRPT